MWRSRNRLPEVVLVREKTVRAATLGPRPPQYPSTPATTVNELTASSAPNARGRRSSRSGWRCVLISTPRPLDAVHHRGRASATCAAGRSRLPRPVVPLPAVPLPSRRSAVPGVGSSQHGAGAGPRTAAKIAGDPRRAARAPAPAPLRRVRRPPSGGGRRAGAAGRGRPAVVCCGARRASPCRHRRSCTGAPVLRRWPPPAPRRSCCRRRRGRRRRRCRRRRRRQRRQEERAAQAVLAADRQHAAAQDEREMANMDEGEAASARGGADAAGPVARDEERRDDDRVHAQCTRPDIQKAKAHAEHFLPKDRHGQLLPHTTPIKSFHALGAGVALYGTSSTGGRTTSSR